MGEDPEGVLLAAKVEKKIYDIVHALCVADLRVAEAECSHDVDHVLTALILFQTGLGVVEILADGKVETALIGAALRGKWTG